MPNLRTSRNEPDLNDLRLIIRDMTRYMHQYHKEHGVIEGSLEVQEMAIREGIKAQDREWRVAFYAPDSDDPIVSGPWTHIEAQAKARSEAERAMTIHVGTSLREFQDGETFELYLPDGGRGKHAGTWEVERLDR